MKEFLILSVVGSVVLTVAINLIPMFFPNAAAKAERKMAEKLEAIQSDRADPDTPRVRVFFPWKFMLIASIVLTVLVNVIGLAAR